MGNITETGTAFADVYKIEEGDEVLGGDGVDDIANKQAHALMQRDNYLLNLLQSNDFDIITAMVKSYTTNDLIILNGCVISATIPGSSTITAGAIAYNGKKYNVPAATVVTTSGQILVFKIDTTVSPNQIYLTNAATGTGIADYNASSVKNYHLLLLNQINTEIATSIILGLLQSYTANDLISLWGGSATINIPGTSTINEFYAYYNGIVYYMPTTTVVTTGGQTIVYKLDTSGGFNFIKAIAGTSGSGIADYNSANVKSLVSILVGFPRTNLSLINSYVVGVVQGGSPRYGKNNIGDVQLLGSLASPSSVTSNTFAVLPVGCRPQTAKQFPVGHYGSGTSEQAVIYVETNGECRIYGPSGFVTGSKNFALDPVRFNIND